MDYLVMSARFNFDKTGDAKFVYNDKPEAVEGAREDGSGTVVVRVDEAGNERL